MELEEMKIYQRGLDLVIFLFLVSFGLLLLFLPIIYCPLDEVNSEIMNNRNLIPLPPRSQDNFSRLSIQQNEHDPISINGNTNQVHNESYSILQDNMISRVYYPDTGHEYALVDVSLPWREARVYCENLGGHLVTIGSASENDFVENLADPIDDDVWIGLNDEVNEGNWEWVTGERIMFVNWEGNQPDGGDEENYVEMHRDGTWNDLPVTSSMSFVCEWSDSQNSSISINGNTQFTATAASEWWLGDGTAVNPFIIENYYFNGTGTMIDISNTDVYFHIRNCTIESTVAGLIAISDIGIQVSNIANAWIHDNIITSRSYGIIGSLCVNANISSNSISSGLAWGIHLQSSEDVILAGNTLTRNTEHEIYISDSYNVTLSNNTVTGNQGTRHDAIQVQSSNNITLFNNFIVGSNNEGFFIANSNDCILLNNTLTSNGDNGISLRYSSNIFLKNNIVIESGFDGIFLSYSVGNTLFGNTVTKTNRFGICFDSTSFNNSVRYNDLFRNNLRGTSQACDEGSDNTFTNNYWDDLTSPDNDGDGIMDSPYLIAGSAINTDAYPLALPASPHQLSKLVVIFPNGGETLTGTVTIQWTAVTDSWGDQIIYSVFYSADRGITWIQIRGDLTTTSTNWDTTSYADGSAYLIKVIATCSGGYTTEDVSDRFTVRHTLPGLNLLFPNGGENLTGIVVIRWTAATDPHNHNITYSLYYSSDSGTTWKSIGVGLTRTSYTWVTFALIDSSSYLIKVIASCSDGVATEDTSDHLFSIHNYSLYFSIVRVGLLVISILGAVFFGRRVKQEREL